MVDSWKIFYKDLKTFSYEDGTPDQAPDDGVLLIVQKGTNIEPDEVIVQGGEFYFFKDNKWQQVYDLIKQQDDWLIGVLVSNEEWYKAKMEAILYATN